MKVKLKTILKIYIFLFSYQYLDAQIVSFKPIFYNQCTGIEEDSVIWCLSNKSSIYNFDTEFKDTAFLEAPGEYFLFIGFDLDPISINLESGKLNCDTFLLKKIAVEQIYFHPGKDSFLDCDEKANGMAIDYYFNGNKRLECYFEDGYAKDTIIQYYRNGQVKEKFITLKNNFYMIQYYRNGNIMHEYHSGKKYSFDFYKSGKLLREKNWSNKIDKTNEYFENGQLKMSRSKKRQQKYNSNGNLIEDIKRKEILIFDRIFSFNKYNRKNKFYEYHWKSYTNEGELLRNIVFNSGGFILSPFPDSIQQIREYSFDKVIFYKGNIEHKKIKFDYEKEDSKYKRILILYRQEESKWVIEESTESTKIHKYILENTNN